MKYAFTDSVYEIMNSAAPGQMAALLAKTALEFNEEIENLVQIVEKSTPRVADEVRALLETVAAATASGDRDAITKSIEAFDALDAHPEEKNMSTKNASAAPQTIDEIVAALPEAQRATVKAALEAAEMAKADAVKAKDEAGKAAADSINKKLEDMNKALAESNAEVAKMKDEKLSAEFTKRATDLGATDIPTTATLLKAAFGRAKEEGEQLEKVLSAAFAQAKKGREVLLKVVGSSGEGAEAGTAEAQLDAIAKEIETKSNGKLSYHQAYDKAVVANPELYSKVA